MAAQFGDHRSIRRSSARQQEKKEPTLRRRSRRKNGRSGLFKQRWRRGDGARLFLNRKHADCSSRWSAFYRVFSSVENRSFTWARCQTRSTLGSRWKNRKSHRPPFALGCQDRRSLDKSPKLNFHRFESLGHPLPAPTIRSNR